MSGYSGEAPATDGTAYGATALEGPGDPQVVLPVGAESSSVAIRAPQSNNDIVYVGWDDDITQSNGFPIYAGDTISLDINNVAQTIFGISATAGDEVRYLLME